MTTTRELDAIIRTGEALNRALEGLERPHLRALADRLDFISDRATKDLQVGIRRRLVGLHKEPLSTGGENTHADSGQFR